MDKVLAFSKKLLKEVIDKNSIVVDATAGNGNDTLFLAKTSAKKIYAFDIQGLAIENTTRLIKESELTDKCEVILDSHFEFDKYIDEKIRAVVFNLGYLPNADHEITTLAETTLATIKKFLLHLEIGGRIVIVIYWGHKNGKVEKETLLNELQNLDQKQAEVLVYQFINQKNNAPFIIAIEKRKEIGAALRIRYTNKKTEMTLKVKGETQNVEINVPLDERYPKEPTVLPILPNEIIAELEQMNVRIKTPMLIQKIGTLRHEITLEEGLFVLDKTTFINDIVDYELEFEAKDYETGLVAFEKLLEENNIDKNPAKPKIARAIEYSKR